MKKNENLLVKSNPLNECYQNLPINEHKILSLAFVLFRENGESSHFVRVDAKRYAEVYEVDLSTAHLALKQCVEKLITRQFTFYKENKNKVKTTWVSGVEYVYGENAVIIALSPHVVDEITKRDANFTSYYLEQIKPFKSVYSIRIFEIIKQWKSAGKTPPIAISDFRFMLGIMPDEYSRINNFKAKVLDVAINEINQSTDLIVSYTQTKKGRQVSGFQFFIKPKKTKDITPKTLKDDNGDYWLNDKQVNYFSNLLAKDPVLGSNHCPSGKNEVQFAMQLASELKGTAKQREFLKPYLLKHGFDMKFALSQPPTTTPQPQEPVVVNDDDRASKIYKTVELVPTAPPVSGGDSAVGLEMFEKFKSDFENLKQKKSVNEI